MTSESKKNNWGLIVGLVLLAVVVLAFILKPSQKATETVDKKTDSDAKPKDDTKKENTPSPTPPSVKNCWKRKSTDTSSFVLPSRSDLDALVVELRKFYNDDFISHAAAFCKGLDTEFTIANVKEYRAEIRDFMKKTPKKIVRNEYDFYNEIQNQVFNPGDLDCQTTTFSQHYLI